MSLAKERLQQRDPCASLVLARWAVASLEQSVTYCKPKLAEHLRRLEANSHTWKARHAAYLPLLAVDVHEPPVPFYAGVYPKGHRWFIQEDDGHALDQRGQALLQAQRWLAVNMAYLPQQANDCVPSLRLLSYDTLLLVYYYPMVEQRENK